MILSELLHFQEKKLGASISLEPLHPIFYADEALKLTPDQYLHHSAFCRIVKSGNMKTCSEHKESTIKKAKTCEVFSVICPFGIWELCAGISLNGILYAVLYLGIYRTQDHPPQTPERVAEPPLITAEQEEKLQKSALFISDFIVTELEIFLSRNGFSGKQRSEEFYIENCRNFIESHYSENIALADVAELLKMNPNYLGPLLLRKTSMTFRELLTEKRIAEAKIFLRLHRNLTISEVASACGFADSNYFSSVFRKATGVPPSRYRAESKSSGE